MLKDTATTSTKERCALDSGLVIVRAMAMLNALTGWTSVSRIFVEEVPKAQA